MYPANKMAGGVKQGGNKETSSVQAWVVPYNLHKNVNICGDLEMVVCQHNPIIKEYGYLTKSGGVRSTGLYGRPSNPLSVLI